MAERLRPRVPGHALSMANPATGTNNVAQSCAGRRFVSPGVRSGRARGTGIVAAANASTSPRTGNTVAGAAGCAGPVTAAKRGSACVPARPDSRPVVAGASTSGPISTTVAAASVPVRAISDARAVVASMFVLIPRAVTSHVAFWLSASRSAPSTSTASAVASAGLQRSAVASHARSTRIVHRQAGL